LNQFPDTLKSWNFKSKENAPIEQKNKAALRKTTGKDQACDEARMCEMKEPCDR